MKYSELISFNPIEDIIQLTSSDDANKAREYVKSYVMSDTMAENIQEDSNLLMYYDISLSRAQSRRTQMDME